MIGVSSSQVRASPLHTRKASVGVFSFGNALFPKWNQIPVRAPPADKANGFALGSARYSPRGYAEGAQQGQRSGVGSRPHAVFDFLEIDSDEEGLGSGGQGVTGVAGRLRVDAAFSFLDNPGFEA